MLNRFKHILSADKNIGDIHPLRSIALGSTLLFADSSPIKALVGEGVRVVATRSYHFDSDITHTYTLRTASKAIYHLTVAEDAQGLYLGIARELPRSEWNDWFDLDALDFFVTPSTARTLKLLPEAKAPVSWSAKRYQKMIDAVEGELKESDPVNPSPRSQRITYTLLASDEGDKSIEIERLHDRDMVRLYATIYRPQEDVISVAAPSPYSDPVIEEFASESEPQIFNISDALKVAEQSLRDEVPVTFSPKQGARPDFRRISPVQLEEKPMVFEPLPLPSFLLEPQKVSIPSAPEEFTFADILAPETTQLRCDMVTARALIAHASQRNVTVKDTVRSLLGLRVDVRDEVVFEVPLSDEDYKELAMRYQMKASRREDIQMRMMQELRSSIQRAKMQS
jgi:hypothetical protein